jgi:hypothetical protein
MGVPPPCGSSPIVVDVAGEGFFFTDAAHGVNFDIYGTGRPIRMGWTAQGVQNAFLALPGPDGLVHNGTQLFGNYTAQPPSDTPNGFATLAVYDSTSHGGNADGVIDSRDAIHSSLRLWIDANHDGISQPEELHTLESEGVRSIHLDYKESRHIDQYGNVFRFKARINGQDIGKKAFDVFFVVP